MTKRRKRINVSLDIDTYEELQKICKQYDMDSCPTLLVAFAHLLLDCMTEADKRRQNMAEGDRAYLLDMFDSFGHAEAQPDGTRVPKKGCEKHIDTIRWQRTKNTED